MKTNKIAITFKSIEVQDAYIYDIANYPENGFYIVNKKEVFYKFENVIWNCGMKEHFIGVVDRDNEKKEIHITQYSEDFVLKVIALGNGHKYNELK